MLGVCKSRMLFLFNSRHQVLSGMGEKKEESWNRIFSSQWGNKKLKWIPLAASKHCLRLTLSAELDNTQILHPRSRQSRSQIEKDSVTLENILWEWNMQYSKTHVDWAPVCSRLRGSRLYLSCLIDPPKQVLLFPFNRSENRGSNTLSCLRNRVGEKQGE